MPVVEWALAAQPAHVAYNVAPDWTDSLHDLGVAVSRRSRKALPVIVAHEGSGKEYSGDNARLRREMPSMKFTPTELAIDRLFQWYADHRSEIDRSRLDVDQ